MLNSYNLLKVTVIIRFKIKFTIKERWNENWDLNCFGLGKWDLLMYWNWDLTRGKGSKSKSQLIIYKEADRSLPMHLCPGFRVAAKISIFRCLRKIAKIERLALFWKLVAKIAKATASCHGCRFNKICENCEKSQVWLFLALLAISRSSLSR